MLYIFDFDYTLVDTSNAIVTVFKKAFEDLKLPTPSSRSIRDTIGMTLEDSFYMLGGTEENCNEFIKAFRQHADENDGELMVKDAIIYPETLYVLNELYKKNNTIIVFSAKDHKTLVKCAKKFQFDKYVTEFIGFDDLQKLKLKQKPSGEGVEYLLDQYRVTTDEAVYIGDSETDLETANDAGVRFIATNTGFSYRKMKKLTDTYMCESLSDVLTFEQKQKNSNIDDSKLFISWSGDLTKEIASNFFNLLNNVFSNISSRIFFSQYIEYGKYWYDKINNNLEKASYGVVFLSKNNLNSSWLNYELGGLSVGNTENLTFFKVNKNVDTSHSPVNARQECPFTKNDIKTLLKNIKSKMNLQYQDNIDDNNLDSLILEFIYKKEECCVKKYYADYSYLKPQQSKTELINSELRMIYNYIKLLTNDEKFSIQLEIQLCDFENNSRVVQYSFPHASNKKVYDLYFSDIGKIVENSYNAHRTQINAKPFYKNITKLDYENSNNEYKNTVRDDLRYFAAYPVYVNGYIIAVLELQFYNDNIDFPDTYHKKIKDFEVYSTISEYVRNLGYLLCI